MGTLGPAKGSGGSRASIDSAVRDGLPPESRNLYKKIVFPSKSADFCQNGDLPPPLAGGSWAFPLGFRGKGSAHGFPRAGQSEQRGPRIQERAHGEDLVPKSCLFILTTCFAIVPGPPPDTPFTRTRGQNASFSP